MFSQEIVSNDLPSTEPASDGFAHVAESLLGEPGRQGETGFSADPGLRLDGKLFAMLRDGELVVRVSSRRADELVRTCVASRFYGVENLRLGQGVAVSYSEPDAWLAAAREALRYAGEGRGVHPVGRRLVSDVLDNRCRVA